MRFRQYLKKYEKRFGLDHLRKHLIIHGYDPFYVDNQISKYNQRKQASRFSLCCFVFLLVSVAVFFGPSFTGFLVFNTEGNLSMSLWGDDISVGQAAYFYANLTNSSGDVIEGAECNIEVLGSLESMDYSEGNYVYSDIVDTAGDVDFNVTCNSMYGNMTLSDSIIVEDIVEVSEEIQEIIDMGVCDSDIILSVVYSGGNDGCCDSLNQIKIEDDVRGFPPVEWNDYDNATILLPDDITTTDSLTIVLDADYYEQWVVSCTELGEAYSINITFLSASSSCYLNTTLNLSRYSGLPSLSIIMPAITNMTIGSTYYYSVLINNSGTAPALDVLGNLASSDQAIIVLDDIISNLSISNGTFMNYSFTMIPLSGGDVNLSVSSMEYKKDLYNLMPLLNSTSNTFHVNYNPSLVNVSNVTMSWNSSTVIGNLSDIFVDPDDYDTYLSVSWNYTGATNVSVSFSYNVLNVSTANNWAGQENITLSVSDYYNVTANISFFVRVENTTSETCNNIDDDGDTLVDEGSSNVGLLTASCCPDGYSCSSTGQKTCIAGAWSDCVGYVGQSVGGGSDNTVSINPNDGKDDLPEELPIIEPEPICDGDDDVEPVRTTDEVLEDLAKWLEEHNQSIEKNILNYTEVNFTKGVEIKDNKTQVAIVIEAEEGMTNFTYIEEIPKCAVELIKAGLLDESIIKFDNPNFEIIDEDPLLMWHFENIEKGQVLKLGYEINKEVVEDCLEEMKKAGLMLGNIKIEEPPMLSPTGGVVNSTASLWMSAKEFLDQNASSALIGSFSLLIVVGIALFQIYFRGPVESRLKREIHKHIRKPVKKYKLRKKVM